MSSKKGAKKGFKFPPCYDYPPFWTLQVNEKTREEQLKLWGNLVCAFMQSINKTELDVLATLETPLFYNKKLGRQLSKESVDQVIEFLIKSNNAKWLDDQKIRARIIWRTPEEWGNIIRKYYDSIGKLGEVLTYEEIINGEETEGENFHGINPQMFNEAMQALEAKGKAKIFPNKMILESGVKFL